MSAPLSNVAGIRRQQHFENGGNIAGWRGRAKRVTSAKKEASKKACRKGNW